MHAETKNIIVQSILEQGSSRVNEDCLVIQDNIFGVFDGATSLNKKRFENGRTGGQLAANAAKIVFRKNHFPLPELADLANFEIMNQMLDNGVDISQKENLWSTSAAVIRIREKNIEWIQTGDAMIIAICEDGSHKVLVERENHDYDTMCLWRDLTLSKRTDRSKNNLSQGTRGDEHSNLVAARKKLAEQIRNVRLQMNISYGVLNGEKQSLNLLNQGVEPLEHVRHILLFTDGLNLPCRAPEQRKDFSDLVSAFLSMGLDGLKEQIRKIEKTDPDCLLYPRFKCHDDIAAIALTF